MGKGLRSIKESGISKSPIVEAKRVDGIILSKDDEGFEDYGYWSSIGTIFYNEVDSPKPSSNPSKELPNALPLFPNLLNYPILNEIVYIISLSDNEVQTDSSSEGRYYFTPVNLWNSIHHNAIPDNLYNTDTLPESQQRDYKQTSGGSYRRVTDTGTEIPLGETFNEKPNIRNLLP